VKEKDLHAADLIEEYSAAIEEEEQDNEAPPGNQAKGRRGARATLPAIPPLVSVRIPTPTGQRSNFNPD